VPIQPSCTAPETGRLEVVLLGGAGQHILTAGGLLCLAGAAAGRHVTQKNDYPITVKRGHCVSEIILDDARIDYTGIEHPSAVIALAPEGVLRRQKLFDRLRPDGLVIRATGVDLPPCRAEVIEADFKARKIKPADWAMAALAILAGRNTILSEEMLTAALELRFEKPLLETAKDVIKKAKAIKIST
jgi:Pyruvate/2-oxoacid:ferredoxin oxidoreductase gamma subunit